MQKKRIFLLAILVALFFCLGSCRAKLNEKTLETKAREIHKRILTVDSHCDTPSLMFRQIYDLGVRHQPGQGFTGKIDLPRMVEGSLDAAFFAVFYGQEERTPEGYARARERAMLLLDNVYKMCEKYPDLVGLALSPDDAYRLKKQGKRIAFIGMENGYQIGKDLSLLEEYYKKGVRYITLCHSQDNDICDSSTDRWNPEDNGLSEFGRSVVLECNRLGIMVDVSHASDKSFFEVLKVTKAPVIASHSSCRAICPNLRNLSDEMLKVLAANRGVIQICFLSSYVKTPKPNPKRDKAIKELEEKYGTLRKAKDEELGEKMWEEVRAIYRKYPEEKPLLQDVIDHIDYVVRLVGVDYVGIGTDFDGGGGVRGCDDVSQMYHITEELLRRGYSEEDIEKIWGGNLMRVLREVMEIAKK